MPDQDPTKPASTGGMEIRHSLNVEIPKINILLYADDPDSVNKSSAKSQFLSLGLMLERLKAHEPASATFSPIYKCRYESGNPNTIHKIDDALLQSIDEIWFFGLNQTNQTRPSSAFFTGGPENELDANEVSALQKWMSEANGFPGGGVLMTGDHSNPRPGNALPSANPAPCPDAAATSDLVGLGRAIGRCVPRAGLLRTWEGLPTNDPAESNNTVENISSEFDEIAQRLTPLLVNEVGEPDPQGQPHPLFYYKPGKFITFFPDHPHEGSLTTPDTFDPAVWPAAPNGPQPLPHVVAKGINQRTSEPLDIIAAYHGDRAGVGRIVVDSSWHHYFNFNLEGFPDTALEDSAGDQIGQFYANLAIWLAPASKRRQMAHAIFWQLAKYSMRMEFMVNDPQPELRIGKTTDKILAKVASPCEIHELLQAVTPERYGAQRYAERRPALSHLPSRELLLGSIMCCYHAEVNRADAADESYVPLTVDEVIATGFNYALEKHVELLKQKTAEAESFLG